MNKKHDLIIIGAGPAGLNASVYASRYGVDNIVVGSIGGGLTTETHEIGNWLGTQKITGFEFAQNALEHAKSLKAEIKNVSIDQIERNEDDFSLLLSNGEKISSKTVLLAMGTKHRHLGIPGENEFAGKGVSYCATCDGFFYKEKTVAVIGGSDSAASAAIYLADIAEKVYVIYRKDKLRAESFWVSNIEKNPKIEVIYNTNVKEIKGDQQLEKVILDNTFNDSEELKLDGLFVEIGLEPSTSLIKNINIETDEEGYIKIEADGKTTEKGVWAAGDITDGSNKFKQIVTAASEGAIAASSIQKHLRK